MGLLNTLLLTEAKLRDTITTHTTVTYESLINAILDTTEKAITDKNTPTLAKELDVTVASLKRYVVAAKKSKFLLEDGTVPAKYNKSSADADVGVDDSGGGTAPSIKLSTSLDAKELKFVVPKVSNNNLFSSQIFKILSLMDGQSSKSGIKNSLMLTGDPGTGKCLSYDTDVDVVISAEFLTHIMHSASPVLEKMTVINTSSAVIRIQIGALFEFMADYKTVTFIDYHPIEIEDNTVGILDEFGNFVSVSHMITKKDSIRKITFDSGIVSKTAADHLYFDGNKLVHASAIKIGDSLKSSTGKVETVAAIQDGDVETVYDLTVESVSHLYQTSNGLIHHNTSFIKNYAQLLGLPLITIEAPHITEEHIINIPFMIMRGDSVKKDSANMTLSDTSSTNFTDGQAFDIVQSESNLVTKLKDMKNMKLGDSQHVTMVAKDKNLRGVYATYRTLINQVRSSFNCILFLDEYYRNDNIKIRNILRNILNGRIGNDKIPPGTFIVYASNLADDGLDEIPMNNDFAEMEFKSPDKEQWFDYIIKKYENNDKKEFPHIKLDHRVYNKFYNTLEKDDLSYDDTATEVRTSPRRWEQFLLYINANLPVANVKEARILMSNVEVNFRNYIDGGVSDIYPKIHKMIVELIAETSGIAFDGVPHPQTEWHDVLEQQLATKIKMDSVSDNTEKEARKYVPVVSGDPGIGKCLRGNQLITVDISPELFNKIMELRIARTMNKVG